MPPKVLWALALLAIPLACPAGLTWKTNVQDFQCSPEEKSVDARFAFKNTGSTPITIKELHTSCGCTTARLDKKIYAPGESGEIVATYNFKGQTGALRKTVSVLTDDTKEPMVLDIRVFRHEPFEVKPSLVYWRTGEPGEAKAVQLVANGYPVHVKSVTSSNPLLAAAVQTVRDGERYTISITPKSTAQKEAGEITVTTDFPAASPRVYKIQARIK
jgi:hypothetical protein